jgi:spermidine synthase
MNKKRLIYISFFLSGATALMYEIIWTRYFSLTFGSTTYSITTVLTAFMSGLALGSLVLGRVVDRIQRRLRLYGWIELLIGIYALLFPLLFRFSSGLYLDFIQSADMDLTQKLFLKFGLSFLIMLIPSTLMGGTLPVISRFFVRDLKGLPSKLGILYAVNTAGAVAGTFLIGFYFIAGIGINASMLAAAAINVGIGITMILYAGRSDEIIETKSEAPSKTEGLPLDKDSQTVIKFAVIAFAISGFVSLSYEVIWTRLLSLIIGSSTYAFSITLIGFLLGIALGSYLISHTKIIPYERISIAMFSWIQIGIGISAFTLVPLFSKLPYLMLEAFKLYPQNYQFITFYQFALALLIMIIPTTLMGATLPLIGKIVSRKVDSVGSSIGNIYFFNTFGAIFGAFLTGFLFIPWFGTLDTLKSGITINIVLGIAGFILVLTQRKQRTILLISILIAAAGLTGIWRSKWDASIMDSGVSIYGPVLVPRVERNRNLNDGSRIVYFQEGINATITVRKNEHSLFLRTNGKSDASTGDSDMTTQTFLGYLPMLLHPSPEKALIIGMGSGVTASTVAQYDSVRYLDIVEIEPSIMKAASFFERVNYNVMEDPKTRVIINDARNHLLETKDRYDLIVSEPSNPWISGIGSLYTSDYFKIVNKRLNNGGIFCQWIHSYSMSSDNLKMIFRTMAASFKDIQLWDSDAGDFLLIGSNEEIKTDPDRIKRVVNFSNRTKSDFSKYLHVEYPVEIFGRIILDRPGVLKYSQGSRINSDNHPYLEFLAPKDLYLDEKKVIQDELAQLREINQPKSMEQIKEDTDIAAVYHYRSKLFANMKSFEKAGEFIEKALALDSSRAEYYFQSAEILFWQGHYDQAVASVNNGLEIERQQDGRDKNT